MSWSEEASQSLLTVPWTNLPVKLGAGVDFSSPNALVKVKVSRRDAAKLTVLVTDMRSVWVERISKLKLVRRVRARIAESDSNESSSFFAGSGPEDDKVLEDFVRCSEAALRGRSTLELKGGGPTYLKVHAHDGFSTEFVLEKLSEYDAPAALQAQLIAPMLGLSTALLRSTATDTSEALESAIDDSAKGEALGGDGITVNSFFSTTWARDGLWRWSQRAAQVPDSQVVSLGSRASPSRPTPSTPPKRPSPSSEPRASPAKTMLRGSPGNGVRISWDDDSQTQPSRKRQEAAAAAAGGGGGGRGEGGDDYRGSPTPTKLVRRDYTSPVRSQVASETPEMPPAAQSSPPRPSSACPDPRLTTDHQPTTEDPEPSTEDEGGEPPTDDEEERDVSAPPSPQSSQHDAPPPSSSPPASSREISATPRETQGSEVPPSSAMTSSSRPPTRARLARLARTSQVDRSQLSQREQERLEREEQEAQARRAQIERMRQLAMLRGGWK